MNDSESSAARVLDLDGLAAELGGKVRKKEVLAPRTTMRTGGPADLLIEVRTVPELVNSVRLACKHEVPFFILGNGSNILVLDGGIRGLVIENHCDAVSIQEREADRVLVSAESGASLPGLANRCSRQGWSGLEWAIGIPGTIGGSIIGNAGAHGGCVGDRLVRVQVLDAEQNAPWLPKATLGLGYRTSRLKQSPGAVILVAEIELTRAAPMDCVARMNAFTEHRRRTQPTGQSAGSIFKNPSGDFAGRLIETAGLKGTCVNQAQVSDLHANFIVNRGGATAGEVLRLIGIVRERVKGQFGVDLELEIQIVGEAR